MATTEVRPGVRVRVRGRQWRVREVTGGTDCAAVRLTEIADREQLESLTILTPFDRPMVLDRAPSIHVVRPRRWLHDLDRTLVDVRPFGSLAALARTSIRLFPYQLEPALAMLRHGAARILIADAVGLGKTIQAGIMLAELTLSSDTFRAIVLVPAGLRDQWAEELAAHFGLAAVVADSNWLRTTASERPSGVNPWSLAGTYIASHDFVKRPEALRPLEDARWDLVVVDEAHAAASGTDRRNAIDAIAMRSDRVVLLTATPHADDPAEFTMLRRLGRVDQHEAEMVEFARTRRDIGGGLGRRTMVLAVRPSEAELRMHELLRRYCALVWREAARRDDDRARLASIVLCKRALSSAGSLAASIARRAALLAATEDPVVEQMSFRFEDEDPLEDQEPLAILATPGLDDSRRERRWLGTIAEAARLAAHGESKIRCLLRLLARVQEPAIVFTEYRDTLVRLQRIIAATGRRTVVLHGGMSPAERTEAARVFNHGAATLLATDAAAEGLNLHYRCRIVVHYELPWSATRLEQRVGRVDRFGQSRRVHEIALVANDTAERLVIAPLAVRASRARRAGYDSSLLDTLTESRVAELIIGVSPVRNDPPSSNVAAGPLRGASEEAYAEVARLERERQLMIHSPQGHRRFRTAGPCVARMDCTSDFPAGLVLVYVIDVDSVSGRHLHREAVIVRLASTRDVSDARSPRQVRPIIAGCLTPSDPVLRNMLDRIAGRIRTDVLGAYRLAQSHVVRRRRAMSALRAIAARRLIQPGLFDRRSIRASNAHEGGDEQAWSSDEPELRSRTTLAAALIASARKRSGSER